MKILHAITSLDKGGAENHVTILSKEQKKNKNDVFIFVSKNSFYWINDLKISNIKIFKSLFFKEKNIFFKIIKLMKDILYLSKLLNKIKPDILHAHLPYMELVCFFSIFLVQQKPKFIITKHLDSDFFRGSSNQKPTFIGLFFAKMISSKSDGVIAISNAVKKYFILNIPPIKKKISLIYYGLDDLNLLSKRDVEIKKLKKYKNYLVLGCIARLVPQKSIENLLFSLTYLKQNKIKLFLIGNGPLKKSLKKLSKDLKVDNQIIWINFIDDVKSFYKSIDIFVLTSLYEGLGLVFLEAMLCKKPVISSNKSAMKEIINNNVNGLLVPPNDPNKLSKAILKLNDKRIRFKMGNAGYKIIKEKFSTTKMYKKTQKVYQE